MRSYDVYCAICGAPHTVLQFTAANIDSGLTTEDDLPKLEQTRWLGDTRILGENHNAPSTNKWVDHRSIMLA